MPNILQRLFSRPEAKNATPLTEALLLDLDLANHTRYSYPKLVDESYNSNSIAHRAVTIITEAASSVPWLLYQQQAHQDEEVTKHPILDLLRRPNAEHSGRAFRALLTADLKVAGEAFVLWLSAPGNRRPELHLLRPDLVTVKRPDMLGGDASYHYNDGKGHVHTYGPDEVLHIKTLDLLRSGRGFSSVRAIAADLDQSNLAGKWNVSLLRNAGRPSLLILTKSALSESQLQQMREQRNALMAGAANAGRIAAFAGEDIQIKDLGMSPKDMDWIEGQRAVESRIASGLGVPPELLNLGQATFNNRTEAKRSFYQETIVPLVSLQLEALTAWLEPKLAKGESVYLAAYWEKVDALAADKASEYARIDASFTSGWLKINEAREEAGFDADPTYGELYAWEAQALAKYGSLPAGSTASAGKSERKTLTTSSERKAFWDAQQRKRAAYQAALAKRMRRHFDAERLRLKTATGDPDAVLREALDPAGLTELLTVAHLAVMEDFAADTLAGLSLAGEPFGAAIASAHRFAAQTAEKAAQEITGTTRRELLQAAAGDAAGASGRMNAAMLEHVIPVRSETIARTETVKASNAGAHFAAAGASEALEGVWVASRGEHPRASHLKADGQAVPVGQAFVVGGGLLAFPGDPSAPAGEVVGCECSVAFRFPAPRGR